MDQVTELSYALDTFYFLVCGALVMWMAAGFTMLEAGLVRAKNTAEILTKNVGLYSIACIMYMLVGYNLMYPGDGALIEGILGSFTSLGRADNSVEDVLASGGDVYYSGLSDFFFQVVFVATAMSGFGSMAACAAGELAARWVTSEPLPDYAAALSLARYDNTKLMAELARQKSRGVL